jgi:hypothetical protein
MQAPAFYKIDSGYFAFPISSKEYEGESLRIFAKSRSRSFESAVRYLTLSLPILSFFCNLCRMANCLFLLVSFPIHLLPFLCLLYCTSYLILRSTGFIGWRIYSALCHLMLFLWQTLPGLRVEIRLNHPPGQRLSSPALRRPVVRHVRGARPPLQQPRNHPHPALAVPG